MISAIPIYERDFSPEDPLIGRPHKKQQISSSLNDAISLYFPVAIAVIVGILKKSKIDIHHAFLAGVSGSGLSHLVTEFLKNRVGRLRPDFISRCKWDTALQACTGSASSIHGGRQSFPSGHTTNAFAGMTFLSLYLTAQFSIFASPSASSPSPLPFSSSKLARLAITISPLFYALWVAISRVEDNRHHIEDVVIGGLIGLISSMTCFFIYWRNPFSTVASGPRSVYTDDTSPPPGPEYHLAGVDDV